jgi:hypothetical protein
VFSRKTTWLVCPSHIDIILYYIFHTIISCIIVYHIMLCCMVYRMLLYDGIVYLVLRIRCSWTDDYIIILCIANLFMNY